MNNNDNNYNLILDIILFCCISQAQEVSPLGDLQKGSIDLQGCIVGMFNWLLIEARQVFESSSTSCPSLLKTKRLIIGNNAGVNDQGW